MEIQDKVDRFKQRLLNFALVVVILENCIAFTWNVDPYHEGAIFPTAVGMAQGLHVFSQVNQQYGFLLPLVISFFLKYFGYHLIVQRMVGLAIIFLIGLLLYKLLQPYVKASKFLVTAWLGISPIWSWPPPSSSLSGGVWPNHLALLLLLFGLFLLRLSIDSRITFFLASFVIFLSSQARMEFILVFFLVTAVVVQDKRREMFFWFLGALSSMTLILTYFASINSLHDWFEQTIKVWTMNPPDVPLITINFFLFNGINFLGVFTLCATQIYIFYKLINFGTKNIYSLIIGTSVFLFLLISINLINSEISFRNYSITDLAKYIIRESLFGYINVVLVGSIIGAGFLLREKISHNQHLSFETKMLLASALGLLGLMHNVNPDYTHIVIPLYLILLCAVYCELEPKRELAIFFSSFLLFLTSVLLVSTSLFFFHLAQQKNSYKNEMLVGLTSNSTVKSKSLDNDLSIIARYVSPGRMLMDCQTGLYSVSSSGYLPFDKWSWNQQPIQMISGRYKDLTKFDSILVCHLNNEDALILQDLLVRNIISREYKGSNIEIFKIKSHHQ